MIAFGYYLLKVIFCSGLLFLYYHVALRNKLFHQWNRFYLLATVVLSLIIPCLRFSVLPVTTESKAESIQLENIQVLNAVQAADQYVAEVNSGGADLSGDQLSIIVYSIVSAVMLALFLLALFRIRSIIRSNPVMLVDEIKFVNTEEKDSPFSFFNYVFWNKRIELNTPSGEHIFQHELVHVREKHSFDKIFLQLVLIGFWCNPFFWLIRKELRMVHEFIADKKSVAHADARSFAEMILQATYPNHYNYLANQFFQSSIKRRLSMLTRKYNPRISYISRLLALPLFAFIVLAFTLKTKEAINIIPLEEEMTVVIDAGHGGATGARVEGYLEDELVLQLAKTIKANNRNDRLKILLTRETEQIVDLKERVEFTRVNDADLFISLHMNAVPISNTKRRTSGYEVGVSNKNTAYQKQSELLASALIKEISTSQKTWQGLIKRQTGIWVLDQNICPSVMIDCGYITNKDDRDFILKKENQELIAQKILKAIEVYAANNTTGKILTKQSLVNDTSILPEVVVADLTSTETDFRKTNRDTTLPKSIYFDGKQKIAIEFDEISHSTTPEKSTVKLATAVLIVNGEKVPNDIFKRKTIITNKLKFIEGKDAVKTYGQAAAQGAVVFEGARYIDVPVAVYYKDVFYPKEAIKSSPDNKVFERVEVEAQFPGGIKAWNRYLERNLNSSVPGSNKAPKGSYTVVAKFLVHKDGTISDVKALTSHGYGMEEEVVRVIRVGPKWTPPIQNGRNVNAYQKQPITFRVSAL